MRLGRDYRHLEQLAAQLGLSTLMVTRYAKGASPITWLTRLANLLGGGGKSSDRMKVTELPPAVLAAIEQAIGGTTREAPEERRAGGRGAAPPRQPGGGRTIPPPPPGDNGQSGAGSGESLPPGGFNRSRFNPNFAPPLPGERNPLSDEIVVVGQSSNVYSFAYDSQASTLYVTYQGHKINPGSISRGRVKRGRGRSRPQLKGELGSTVTGERGGRGAMYAYFDVPARVFERMKLATSKGKFVWDELRQRGTIHGHKYRYSLVQGYVSTQQGVQGVYIPRKATAGGFRSRSVADLGTGKRGFQTSTLPAQNGFSTRRRGR